MFRRVRPKLNHATVVAYLALFVALGGTALAGSGVGGIFNLGQSNTVDATTPLSGATAGAQLSVTNTSTATGATALSLTTAAGKPPLAVSNTTLVPNLNAGWVGGFKASSLIRVGQATGNLFDPGPTSTPLATATIVAPKAGFVRVDGNVGFDDRSDPLCQACYGRMRLHDVSANVDSPVSEGSLRSTANGAGGQIPLSQTWVFPVTSGTHQYSLIAGQGSSIGGPGEFHNAVIVAQYVPFGYAGTSALAPPSHAASKAVATRARR
jgi:hypothetical protein